MIRFLVLLGVLVAPAVRAATVTVTHEMDVVAVDSKVTLREAIISMNAGADVNSDVTNVRSGVYGSEDEIRFLMGAGPRTIAPAFPLPVIAVTVTIDGGSQPGFEVAPIVTIDGSAAGPAANGLVIASTTATVVEDLLVQNFGGTGILIVEGEGDHTPPVANLQSVATGPGEPIQIQLTASDPDDSTFTFAVADSPLHGAISNFNTAEGTLTYTPTGDYTGSDAFTFTAADETHTSAPATVAIEIISDVPANVIASAVTTTRVDLSWGSVPDATSYQIDRKSPGTTFEQIATSSTNSYSDNSVEPSRAYQYRVRSVIAGFPSGNSNADLATTVIFADHPLAAGTIVKAVHIDELRVATNAVRQLAGQVAASFTDPVLTGVAIKAVHLSEIRTALDDARAALGLLTGGHTDDPLTGVAIKAMHIQELRARVE